MEQEAPRPATLIVLRMASEKAERLHEQYVEFREMPKKGRLFRCTNRQGQPFQTAAVNSEPRAIGTSGVLFSTRDTHYLLEIIR